MRYHWFRQCGLFVGSGVVEAGCKTVVGLRLKQAGMHWTTSGADAIIALRCREASSQREADLQHFRHSDASRLTSRRPEDDLGHLQICRTPDWVFALA